MISGTVWPNRRAIVAVELLGADGQFQPFDFALDTGFDGALSLPSQTLHGLVVAVESERAFELADGSRTTARTWAATALWDGTPRAILIVEMAGERLLGMDLLWQSRITLEARAYGPVEITPLG